MSSLLTRRRMMTTSHPEKKYKKRYLKLKKPIHPKKTMMMTMLTLPKEKWGRDKAPELRKL